MVWHLSLSTEGKGNPVAKGDSGYAGIDFKLDDTIVADGNRLTIDGTTFVFKTDTQSDVIHALEEHPELLSGDRIYI